MTDLITGMHYLLRGWRMLHTPGLRRFVYAPITINLLLFAVGVGFAVHWFDRLMERLLAWLPSWLDWLQFILWPLFGAMTLLGVFMLFSLLANLLAAPFNGLLAEAVERHLGGAEPAAGDWHTLLRDVPLSVISELRKLLYMALWAIPFALVFLLPVINLAAPLLWMLFGAWMLAIEYADYPMGNHNLRFAEQRARLRRRRPLALGFGGATLLVTMIPVLNFAVMPAAVAGATIMWVEKLKGVTSDE